MRHPLVMGNWKLNGSRHMVNELVANLRKELGWRDGLRGCYRSAGYVPGSG
ncbi:triosephosphate isomerase [Enterobacter asburiae]|uniref:Triosephosphate isomerase n=1 Tax=Enterobacter asburiae TaxID=61645 RepID=A0A376FH74_ENTAS|nr:triosephosphate isomerase [Enterobacter asburiae]